MTDVDLNKTDIALLTALADGRRQNRTNLAQIVSRQSSYVADRLAHLHTNGLVTQVGPSDQSGLYEITPSGRAILRLDSLPEDAQTLFTPNDHGDPTGPPLHLHPSPRLMKLLSYVEQHDIPTVTDLQTTFRYDQSLISHLIDSAEHQQLLNRQSQTLRIDGYDDTAEKDVLELTSLGERVETLNWRWALWGDRALSAALLTWDSTHITIDNWFTDDDIPFETVKQWINSFHTALRDPDDTDVNLDVEIE